MNFSLSPQELVTSLQTYPAEILTLATFMSCGGIILILMRLYGAVGLMMYSILAVIIANLQVQIASYFFFSPEPIALGTVVFSSTFIVSSILTECYGKAHAQKAVWLSFSGMVMISFFMTLTLGFKPAPGFQISHSAMQTLFLPVPALITASLIAYVVGQHNDIWIFAALSRLTRGKLLWLRSLLAILVGAFLDNVVFSVLAWMVFAPNPLPWKTVFFTYVLGTYILWIFMAFAGIPFIYLAKRMVR